MKPPPFRAFTIKHSGGLANRIITEIKLTPAYDPANPPTPPPRLFPTSALWDTGATRSAITPSLVAAIGLKPTGTVVINHAGGSSQCNTYLVNLFLPNYVSIVGVPVSEFADSAHFGAIIGMDIITRGDFTVTNQGGETWVSFRIPPTKHIDYVEESNRAVGAPGYRVGRNDPCPCGSGKKYKKCCGA